MRRTATSQRINIVLPRETLALLDDVTSKGQRSSFISKAVLHYIVVGGKRNLRERLKQEAILNAERDLAIAAEWFPIEEEAESALSHRRKSKTSRRA
jgi:CopG family transcriptional regulator/antitoxin EndoAI